MKLLTKVAIACLAVSSVKADTKIPQSYLDQIKPLPKIMESPANPITKEKIDLGRKLYFDKRFSKNHDISCNSCHGLDTYGVDNKQFSEGHQKKLGGRNAPTVYNAAMHITQFWDGRAKDVEEQAKGPVLNPVEMAMQDEASALKVINSIPEYVQLFKKAFPKDSSVNYNNFGKAIGAFERKLVTPGKFDKFAQGDLSALNDEEKKGFIKFMEVGCYSCHSGPALGGNLYMKLGLLKSWPGLKDNGRFDITKNPADKFSFKVPSLRNIAKTGPYLHDGSVNNLNTLVGMMAEYQLGKKLSKDDTDSIVTFLKALTGKPNKTYIAKPALPASTKNTPKADPN